LEQHLTNDFIKSQPMIANWKAYLVNMAMPYEKGKLEGDLFCLHWLSFIFKENIQVWSFVAKSTIASFSSHVACHETYTILALETNTSHIHYEPIRIENYYCQSISTAVTTSSNPHTKQIASCRRVKQLIRTGSNITTDIYNVNNKTTHGVHAEVCVEEPPMSNVHPKMPCHGFNTRKHPMHTNEQEMPNKKQIPNCQRLKQTIRTRSDPTTNTGSNRTIEDHVVHNGSLNETPLVPIKDTGLPYQDLEATKHAPHNSEQDLPSTLCRQPKNDAKQTYRKLLLDTPVNKCPICEQLHFAKNMRTFAMDLKQVYMQLCQSKIILDEEKICTTCKRSLENGKLPQLAVPEQIRRNKPLSIVATLSELEERLVSLRIAFAQIRQWGYKRSQMGLTGSIINVPAQMDIIQNSLPQSVNDTTTIAIALKRRLEYKNAYTIGKVRVRKVMKSLKRLCSRYLYKAQKICINREWNRTLRANNDETMQTYDIESEPDTDIDMDLEQPTETLVHGLTESRRIHDLQDKILEIAPAEGQRPLGIFKDKYAEEMTFPSLFYGDP